MSTRDQVGSPGGAPSTGIDAPKGHVPFSREDQETLRSVAVWATAVGVLSIASGLVGAGISFVQEGISGVVSTTVSLAVTALLSVFLLTAAASLRKVTATDAADKLYLVDGLRKLRNYFMTTGILFIVAFSLAVLVVLFVLTCGMLR
ncbi:MAG: hypothetical protein KC503_12230 [Myxococcales bacterium]|nr:hypothetical protein [Myxococcales bacterium]